MRCPRIPILSCWLYLGSSTIDEKIQAQQVKLDEAQEAMADFTFYNNAMSGYAYTDHSLPLMLSGEWFENQESYEDYALRIYRNSPFFERLEGEGYSLSFYDDELQFEVGQMDGEFANMAYAKSTLWDPELFNGRLLKMTGIKYAPYFLYFHLK